MKATLLALTARGAMAHYLDELVPALAEHARVTLVAPDHYVNRVRSGAATVGFSGPASRAARGLAFANPRGAGDVWNAIEASAPDVLHLFNGIDFPWSAVVARRAKRAGIPVVVTLHDPERHPGNIWWLVNSPGRIATKRAATAFHVHAQTWKSKLAAEGFEPGAVHVVPHGSFAPRFLRCRTDNTKRTRLAVFFGRLERYKGLEYLARAAIELEHPVAIAGPGSLPRDAARVAASRPDLFELHTGYQPDEVIAGLLDRASVCVLPYLHATQSSVPLIAAAFGVPVVATAVGAFVEDIPRVNGILVPPRDAKALADGIRAAADTQAVHPADLTFAALGPRFVEMYERVAAAD